jgi:hypothetical protein
MGPPGWRAGLKFKWQSRVGRLILQQPIRVAERKVQKVKEGAYESS